jgi:pyruvate dehydrogenase (quinone)
VPVSAVAAHIPNSEIGSTYFQETHPDQLFRNCSHYCELALQPAQIPRVLEIAIQTALTKKDVSVVAIPGDIALKQTNYRKPSASIKRLQPVLRPSEGDITRLAELLNESKAVTIFGVAGCAGAHAKLIEVARKLKWPIVSALRGREHIQYDNPYDVGLTGLIGSSSGYHAMMDCDTLFMLGTDFPYTQFFPQKATITRGENLGRRTRIDMGLIGDVKETLGALLDKIETKADDRHLRKFISHYQDVQKSLDDLAAGVPGKKPIHPQFLAKVIDEVASADAIFSCDVRTPTVWAARYLR